MLFGCLLNTLRASEKHRGYDHFMAAAMVPKAKAGANLPEIGLNLLHGPRWKQRSGHAFSGDEVGPGEMGLFVWEVPV